MMECSPAQRSKIYALLKDAGYSTYQVMTLKKSDDSIPYLYDVGDYSDSVWDWIGMLTKDQASEVIQYLEQ